MLTLDGVRPSDGGETPAEVRAERKAAILRAQQLVDRVERGTGSGDQEMHTALQLVRAAGVRALDCQLVPAEQGRVQLLLHRAQLATQLTAAITPPHRT